jgi:hypothetical protein
MEMIATIVFNVNNFVYDNRSILNYMLVSFFVAGCEAVLYVLGLVLFVFNLHQFDLAVAIYVISFLVWIIIEVYTMNYFAFAMIIDFKKLLIKGGKPDLLRGISETWQYSWLIFKWAIFEGSVIWVLERLGVARGILLSMFSELTAIAAGITFSVASFFVQPIIIDKRLGPIKSMVISSKMVYENGIMKNMFSIALSKNKEIAERIQKGKSLGKTPFGRFLQIVMVIGAIIFIYGVVLVASYTGPDGGQQGLNAAIHALEYIISGGVIVGIVYFYMLMGNVSLLKTVMYDYFSGEKRFTKMYAPLPAE